MTAVTASSARRVDQASASPFAGLLTLLRLHLRLARIRLTVWVLGIGAFLWFGVDAIGEIYATPQERASRAELMSSPSAVLLGGPGYGIEDYTLPRMIANEYTLLTCVLVAIMAIQLVTARLRGDEEAGRLELVRAGAVGRAAPTLAAISAAAVGCALVTVVILAIILGGGIAGVGDAAAFALGIGLTGLLFGALAAVTSQMVEHARAASGLGYAVLGIAFVVRGAGDIQQLHGSWLSWLSPLAWPQQTRAWVDLRWWPLLLTVVTTAVLTAVAVLGTRRDHQAGVMPTRPGRAHARAWLASPFALAWRLQRTGIAWWALALALYAALCGSLVQSVLDQIDDNPALQQYIARAGLSLTDTFVSVMLTMIVCAVAGWAVGSVLRLRSAERSGQTELVLASPVSRGRWLLGHLAVTVVGSALLLAISGAALGASAAAVLGEPDLTGRTVADSLSYLPAVLVLAGVAAALYGLAPPLTPIAWVPVAWSVLVVAFGGLLQLSDRVVDTSPIGWTPALPAEEMVWGPVMVLIGVALALGVLAVVGWRRRDLTA